MDRKEFKKQWNKAKNVFSAYNVVLIGGGSIYPTAFSFWEIEGMDAVDLFSNGYYIARIPLEFIRAVY